MNIRFAIQKKLGSFHLNAAENFESGMIGIFGESGSGKTTLLHCLAGFVQPDQGEIIVGDEVYFSSEKKVRRPIHQRRMGIVFQEGCLFPHLSVQKNILYGRKKTASKQKVDEIIDLLSLTSLLDRRPQTLSAGERQRAALARTLIHEPSFLLMDEPVASLDWKSRYQILSLLKKIHQSLKVPMIYVSHSVSEMMFLVDKVLLLEKGRRMAYGTPMELISQKLPLSVIQDDLENVYELPVTARGASEGTLTLDWGGYPLNVVSLSRRPQPFVRVGIKAKDVIIALSPNVKTTARNVIPAKVEKIWGKQGDCLLETMVQQHRCLVEITRSAQQELKIAEQQTVHLIIKANSIVVLE